IELRLALRARGEQFEASRIEAAVQTGEQLQHERRQHLLGTPDACAGDLDLGPGLISGIQLSLLLGVHGFQHTRSESEFDYGNFTLLISHPVHARAGLGKGAMNIWRSCCAEVISWARS